MQVQQRGSGGSLWLFLIEKILHSFGMENQRRRKKWIVVQDWKEGRKEGRGKFILIIFPIVIKGNGKGS